MKKTELNRRQFAKLMGATTLYYLSGCSSVGPKKQFSAHEQESSIAAFSPINRYRDNEKNVLYSGDNPEWNHSILWDKDTYMAGLPQLKTMTAKKVKLAIVGGGMSGLMLAYRMRHLSPVILDQNMRFGGNSKGESWQGLEYSIAAAYFTPPEKDGPIDRFLKEVDAYKVITTKKGDEALVLNNHLIHHLESDTLLSGKSKKQIKKFHEHLAKVKVPEIPAKTIEDRKYVDQLDKQTLHQYLTKVMAPESLDPVLETMVEHYCWSSFGGSAGEISAAAGLNFLGGEVDGVYVAKGGNAGIAECVLDKLSQSIPKENLMNGKMVFDVHETNDGVEILSVDRNGVVEKLLAERVVMSCPKFICNKIIRNFPAKKVEALKKVKYRSYMVANVLINQPIKLNSFDVYLLGDGKTKINNVQESAEEQKATDICIANFTMDIKDRTVLTLYRSFPYDDFRPTLLTDDEHGRFKDEFKAQVAELCPVLGLDPKNVVDIRLSRWGHPLPLAAKGVYRHKIIDRLSAPISKNILFCEQDNQMLPAFETAFYEAEMMEKTLRS